MNIEKQKAYLIKKLLQWEAEEGERKTQKAFALYIGLTPTTFSGYYNDGIKPTGENLRKFVRLWGPEVYDIFEVDPLPEDDFRYFPRTLKKAFLEIREAVSKYGLSGDSPEAEILVDDIMKKHGYKSISTIDDNSSQ